MQFFLSLLCSNNTKLIDLHISGGTNFSTLNISNNLYLTSLYITSSSITCIKVNENQLKAIPSKWYKDARAVYSINCI